VKAVIFDWGGTLTPWLQSDHVAASAVLHLVACLVA
jgi:hypothetical protein